MLSAWCTQSQFRLRLLFILVFEEHPMRTMPKRWASARAILVIIALPLWAQQTETVKGKNVASHEVLVKFRLAAAEERITEAKLRADVDQEEGVGGGGVRRFHSSSKNTETLVRELSARPDVEYAEPNYMVYAIAVPNDPFFSNLWGLQNTGQVILGMAGTPG